MRIQSLTPETQILGELGRRLAMVRKQQRWSQTALAEEAGIGVATLRRIEAGQDSQLESWLKILKALGMTASIEALLPEKFESPMAEVLSNKKRGRRPKRDANTSAPWGDLDGQ